MDEDQKNKIDPNTIDWHKFEVIFPYLNRPSPKPGCRPGDIDICPVCGQEVDHLISLFHINAHGKDPVYGIEYKKALDALVYLQLTLRRQN